MSIRTLVIGLLLIQINAFASVEEFTNHIDMASNQKLNMNSRWRSLIRSTEYAESDDIKVIKKFTDNKEWYLRNAALVALNKMDRKVALEEAKKLVSDKALVVRTAAVEIIGREMTADNKKILMDEMGKGYNFNRKSSLWIRKQILEKLAKAASDGDQKFFAQMLFDEDKKISEISAKTLERLTGKNLGAGKLVESWRQYAKQNNLYTK